MKTPDHSNPGNKADPVTVHLSPARKWDEMNKLRQMAWDLKYASVKQCHPEWTDAQIRERVRDIFLYATT
ncbi:MAG: hypothetical protein JW913_04015 [Chitinispirillaceae bacterium]|nr:hypothetical protein [Chitinispirillaceae bacterium]